VVGGWISLGESDTDVVLRATVSATDADSAQMMQQAVDGLRAMIQLAAGADIEPGVKAASDLLKGVTTSRADRDVSMRIAVPLAKLPEVLKSFDVEIDDKGEPGEKNRVRLQLKVGDDKQAKELEAKNKQLKAEKDLKELKEKSDDKQ